MRSSATWLGPACGLLARPGPSCPGLRVPPGSVTASHLACLPTCEVLNEMPSRPRQRRPSSVPARRPALCLARPRANARSAQLAHARPRRPGASLNVAWRGARRYRAAALALDGASLIDDEVHKHIYPSPSREQV